jgi:hypothetical protein
VDGEWNITFFLSTLARLDSSKFKLELFASPPLSHIHSMADRVSVQKGMLTMDKVSE